MSNTAKLNGFSVSPNGLPIAVTDTASPGTLIHTAVAGTTDGTMDEIWLYVNNIGSVNYEVTVEFGAAAASSRIIYSVIPRDGIKCMIPGLPLRNGATIRVYVQSGGQGLINVTGRVVPVVKV